MIEMTERYCLKCGEKIPEGSEYCPVCGAAPDGTPYNKQVETVYMQRGNYGTMPDNLGITPTFTIVYGILAVIFGIVFMASQSMFQQSWDLLADSDGLYMGLTLVQTQTAMLIIGACILVSGICAFIGGFLAKKRMLFVPCMILYVISCVAPLFTFFGIVEFIVYGIILCIIGAVMTHRVYSNRIHFHS